jgi:hypothetical protein
MRLPLRHTIPAVALVWGLGATAGAHSIPFPLRLDLTVETSRLVLAVNWDEDSHDEGPRLRARFDADGDRALDQDEGDALAGWLAREAIRRVSLTVEGVPPSWVTTSLSGMGNTGPVASEAPLGVLAILEAPLPALETLAVSMKAEGRDGPRSIPLRVRWSGWSGTADGTEVTRMTAVEGWRKVFLRRGAEPSP